ncbi:unnamed protein product [Peronospora effusa]|nr:unnamed protein product [Peronospora effusa]CAI5707232.1 unnamed protein product [Peronospora effusa]CAI5707236.1 unnamed protein product [Peronospora effusa]CAI5707240.1 unnamed protein product [Peronospora effusa]
MMALPSRCSSEMHGHVESNADDPMFEIDDVTMNGEDQESVEVVSRQGQMVIRPSQRTSVQEVQETAMVLLESVQHGQSQALCQWVALIRPFMTAQKCVKKEAQRDYVLGHQAELKALEEKDTWTVHTQRPSQKVIGTKWVFALKRNELGEIIRYKARLVALGYKQTCGGVDSQTT